MIRFTVLALLSGLLVACGSPRGPAPVVYRGGETFSPPPAALVKDEAIPDAAPVEPVDSQSLAPLDGSQPAFDRDLQLPDIPVKQAANVAFDAQATAVKNTASGAATGGGHALKTALNVAKTGGKLGRKALASGDNSSEKEPLRGLSLVQPTQQVEVVPAKERPDSIVVGKGDTLFALSEKYQIALKPLIAENNLKAPYDLNVGQRLKLPPPLHYRVRSGDTIMAISRRFSLDFRSLALINGIQPPYNLRVNELLMLPALVRGNDGQWKSAAAARKPVIPTPGAKQPAIRAKPKPRPVRAPAKTSTFSWPLNGPIVSKFGVKPGGTRNDGINISAPAGTAVRAAGDGTVVYAGSELKSFGNLILIRHPTGWVSAYAHNRKLLVKEGAKIKTGDSIAEVGSSGSVSTPQLHFETRRGRDPVNPALHLPKK